APIKIRTVYKATGVKSDTIRADDLWAAGADVTLFHTSLPDESNVSPTDSIFIPMKETDPGRFIPVKENEVVHFDKMYGIKVEWQGLNASGSARIPDYDINSLLLSHQQI